MREESGDLAVEGVAMELEREREPAPLDGRRTFRAEDRKAPMELRVRLAPPERFRRVE